MKVADLRKYRKNVEALEAIDRLLSQKYVADTVQGSCGAPSYAATHVHVEGYQHGSEIAALLAEKSELETEQAHIRAYISGIRNRRIYNALWLYCVDGDTAPTWEKVAEQMHEDNPKALEMAVNRFFDKKF